MIAAARAVGVEVGDADAMFLQILAGRRRRSDAAGGADVIRRDRIAKNPEHARAFDVADLARLHLEAIEVGRVAYIR